MNADDKRVDENWKERAERERQLHQQGQPQGPAQPESAQAHPAQQEEPTRPAPAPRGRGKASPGSDFGLFLSSLSMQALMALGEAAHPAMGQPHEDLEQARYLIDVLSLLQEKTKGNLTPEESALLDGALYELRMKYVARMEKRP